MLTFVHLRLEDDATLRLARYSMHLEYEKCNVIPQSGVSGGSSC